MRIGVVYPVSGGVPAAHFEEWKATASPGTEVVVVGLDSGPTTMLDAASEAAATPQIVRVVRGLQKAVDGIVIGCFCDPALAEARAVSDVPLIGGGEASMFTASCLGDRFTIVTVVTLPHMQAVVERGGFSHSVSSIRRVEVPIEKLRTHRSELIAAIVSESMAATVDGTRTVCLGCTAFAGLGPAVAEATGLALVDSKEPAMMLIECIVGMEPRRTSPFVDVSEGRV
jgi:allantoin racemase